MAQQGCQVTCYNRSGHHVSGAEYDDAGKTEYEEIRQKSVPTIERRGAGDIILFHTPRRGLEAVRWRTHSPSCRP